MDTSPAWAAAAGITGTSSTAGRGAAGAPPLLPLRLRSTSRMQGAEAAEGLAAAARRSTR